jgi:hypothetical protein
MRLLKKSTAYATTYACRIATDHEWRNGGVKECETLRPECWSIRVIGQTFASSQACYEIMGQHVAAVDMPKPAGFNLGGSSHRSTTAALKKLAGFPQV